MYGILRDDLLEVKCNHRWCAGSKAQSIVVLHYFNVATGELVKTIKYKNPKLKER
jgi:hypothetical protein